MIRTTTVLPKPSKKTVRTFGIPPFHNYDAPNAVFLAKRKCKKSGAHSV